MGSAKTGAIYLSSEPAPLKTHGRSTLAVLLSTFLAALTLFVTFTPLLSANQQQPLKAEAGVFGIFCDDGLGKSMEQQDWRRFLGGYPAPDSSGRTLTAQEAFGNNVDFTAYYGEGKGQDRFTKEVSEDRITGVEGEAAMERITDHRNSGNCVLGYLGALAGDFGLGAATFISGISGTFAGFAFNSSIICEEPGQGGACFDLLKIIGGTGAANEGIIGALTSSIYLPLLVLVGMVAAIWLGWTGIVQRKVREALWGFIWVVTAVIIGLTFLLNPALIAKAPLTATNTLAGCVISAFGGNNCLSGAASPSGVEPTSSDICRTNPTSAPVDEQMGLIIEGLTCQVWKAFVLEPYAQGSFGQSFEALDTRNPGTVLTAALEESGASPDDFCVGTRMAGTINENDGALELSGDGVCNVALYQLYLKTDASYNGGGPNAEAMDEYGIDTRWYKIVNVTANNDTLWNYWPASTSGAMHKVMVSGVAALSAFLGGLVIIAIAIFAVMYYVSAIFLTAFAPLFFLIGIHPGRGRDILKGYGEIVIGNVLKYLASALFLVITIALYGGVLGNSQNMGTTLLFVLVLSLALMLYRKELVNLLGRVDMGGKQMSSALGDRLKSNAEKTARFGAVAVGTATGAKLAGGSFGAGLSDGVTRELKSGRLPLGGAITRQAVAGVARGADAASGANERELREQQNDAKEQRKTFENNERQANQELEQSIDQHQSAVDNLDTLAREIDDLTQKVANSGQDEILDRMAGQSEAGAKWVEAARLGGGIAALDRNIEEGRAKGADVSDLVDRRDSMADRRLGLARDLRDSGQVEALRDQYNAEIGEHNDLVNTLNDKKDQYQDGLQVVDAHRNRIDLNSAQVQDAAGEAAAAAAKEDTLSSTVRSLNQGNWVTKDKKEEIVNITDRAAAEARENRRDDAAAAVGDRTARVKSVPDRTFASASQEERVEAEEVEQDVLPGLMGSGAGGIPNARSGEALADELTLPGLGASMGALPSLGNRSTTSKEVKQPKKDTEYTRELTDDDDEPGTL